MGQSLGTAVASAVALAFASGEQEEEEGKGLLPTSPLPSPSLSPKTRESVSALTQKKDGAVVFAGVVLIAPFASLPSLLRTYRIGGVFPILGPALCVPGLGDYLDGRVVDTWRSAERLERYQELLSVPASAASVRKGTGMLQILHARDDRDIDFWQSVEICRGLAGGDACKVLENGEPQVLLLGGEGEGAARTRIEVLEFGGMCASATPGPLLCLHLQWEIANVALFAVWCGSFWCCCYGG